MLTSISAFAELAQDEAPQSAAMREYLAGIRAATARGAALTQQLLAFARKKIVQPQDADLNAILSRMAPMIRRLLGEHIGVELALSPDLRSVKVDVGSIEQVIMNLVVNARDAMPEGGMLTLESQNVVLEAEWQQAHPDLAPGRYAVLCVTDSGAGMTPEVRARLFEPFFTTKPLGIGTGLGLAMCHGIIKQAGGTIAVQSELGSGSAFTIYLPCQAQPPDARRSGPPTRGSAANAGHETLLLVEDEPSILRLAQIALTKLGYRVLCAGDGIEALELARQSKQRIDLLVTDVVMPRLGGRELAQRLGELSPSTKVLYTSGYVEDALGKHGVLSGGVHFIQKPDALAALAGRVREVLDAEPDAATHAEREAK
jgi:CheY-like chemotaxis protein